MSCCGDKRQALRAGGQVEPGAGRAAGPSPGPPPARQTAACFEYSGRTGMTVIGPATGLRYRFDHPGARCFVDLRDRRALADVPNLRQILNPAET